MLTRPTTTAASSLPIPGSCPLSAAPCRDTRVSTTNRYFRVPAATATRLPVARTDSGTGPSARRRRFAGGLSEELAERLHLLRLELHLARRIPAWSVGNRDDQPFTGARPDSVEPVPLAVVEFDDAALLF